MDKDKQFSAEVAESIRAAVKAFDAKAVEKIRKAKDANGSFDVIISVEVKDRAGETVMQDGWEFENYKNNPIVLWGHDYWSLPVGVCTELEITEHNGNKALRAKGVFLSADINPFAQQVRRLYEFGLGKGEGVGCTTSVGFIPKMRAEQDYSTITRAELLEFSFVPVPANQGVGAAGRALTEEEAKTLGLDVVGFTAKGMSFATTKDVENEQQEEAADGEDADDELSEDGEEAPAEAAADIKDPREPQKELVKALTTEHDRHVTEIDKALEEFAGKVSDITKNAVEAETAVRDGVKDLRAYVSDEHTMHRSNTIACFRAFQPTDDKKALDRNKHLKALRTENADEEARDLKALEDFEERTVASVKAGQFGEIEDHIEWLSEKLEGSKRPHKKALVKIAKTLAREALGEEEVADETTIAIVKDALTPFVEAKSLSAISIKVAARITAERRKQLGEAHSHMKAVTTILEELHGALGDVDGEESRSDGEDRKVAPVAPAKQRSRPAGELSGKGELDAHLLTREILRGIATATTSGLEEVNKRLRERR